MMRFIDHEHVPAGGQGLLQTNLVAGQETNAGQHELIIEKRVRLGIRRRDGGASFLVENVKPEIEAPQQFHEPLVNQRFRDDDQDALRPARQQQPVQNQACLDGLAQTHLVGQQDARGQPSRHFGGDVKLVWNEVDPPAGETTDPGLAPPVLMRQRREPKIENLGRIDLPGEQTFLRLVETDGVIEFALAPLLSPAPHQIRPARSATDSTASSWRWWFSMMSPARKRTRRKGALSRVYSRVSVLAPKSIVTVLGLVRRTAPNPSSGSLSLIHR